MKMRMRSDSQVPESVGPCPQQQPAGWVLVAGRPIRTSPSAHATPSRPDVLNQSRLSSGELLCLFCLPPPARRSSLLYSLDRQSLGGPADPPEHNNARQCSVAAGPMPPPPSAADPTYLIGPEAFSGLSWLISSFRNELAQQTLSAINKHGHTEKGRRKGTVGAKVHRRDDSLRRLETVLVLPIRTATSLCRWWSRGVQPRVEDPAAPRRVRGGSGPQVQGEVRTTRSCKTLIWSRQPPSPRGLSQPI
ncbi:hypothetical protein EYF80_042994 [Liparis tanakae]|uniref:Uncharacterized protein n=1 Tax=Liparis tanakae TaxID=230148 RepID=A0A4Z2G1J4_9TELE|nr:hypothetical protein EYF80_042994 [Liparis tanakae]